MSEKEGSSDGGGGHGMKKGPWTAAEDAILAEYVQKHGEGNWNSVQKNSGLMRCGKSCRLRWANHLRPNLKKGAFSPEEERTIIELHAKLGNKWARMAAQLPGRTDNEIKNYWNTRLKRRQRAGLPIYPQEMREETTTPVFHHHLQQQQQQFQFGQSLLGRKRPTSSCCSPPNNTDFPSSQRQKITDHTTNYSSYNFCNYNSPNINTCGNHHQHPTNIPNYTNNTTDIFNLQYCDDNNNNNHSTDRGIFVFPMSQIPSFSTALYSSNQNLDGQFSPSPPRAASGLSYSSLLMGSIGLPHDSAYSCGQDNRESASFDELLMGTQSLSADAQSNVHSMLGGKDKDVPSSGAKQEAVLEEISSMDDDLSSLLTNFQCSIPLPDWHTGKNLPGIC